ncbi:hypothetical protein [uncultured Paludibaculum sp.]|uniref:hypothetical protein n=1 Tax=uncultured Paludibaculum sp. TaxID=1765020 RepID=UPI002AABED1A|nr:hypothetical protein [uncultured Paludibaculum sp.]
MWLAGSVLLLSVLTLAAALTGHAVLALGSSFRKPLRTLWFAPITGLAVWIHAAALLAWTCGFPRPAALASMAGLLALSAWILHRRWRSLFRRIELLAPATLAGGFSLFACLARFSGFNPFNDAYTYLVHARWLQTHPFHEAVTRDVLQPALSQVYLYQSGHHRMGASFLLAWTQSLCGHSWPHDVYPAVVALALACGGLALTGAVALIAPAHRRLLLFLGLLPGLTLSGITFGSVHGFLPQSFGLAFSLAALVLAAGAVRGSGRQRPSGQPRRDEAALRTTTVREWSSTVRRTATGKERAPVANASSTESRMAPQAASRQEHANGPSRDRQGAEAGRAPASSTEWLPAALCLSAQVYTYPEAVPFTLAALLVLLLHRVTRPVALLTLAAAALLAAPEWPRLIRSLAYQVTAVAGVNAPFTAHEALEHATGFNAGPWQDRMSLLFQPHLNLLACLVVLGLAAWGLRRATRLAPLLPLAAVTTILALSWLWFRFGERNPWDGTMGNPWHQARAATYAAYPTLTLIAAGLAICWRKNARLRLIVGAVLTLWVGAGLIQNYRLAEPRLSTMQEELVCTTDCWRQFETLQHQAPPGSIALQGFGPANYKLRRFLTYVLMDHPILSDWRNDDYIGPNLSQKQESAPAPATWRLTPERPLRFQPNIGKPAD